ncbi:hypothetical protein BCR37DRAFT_377721 [Protomyces lactucae-debilis]|uniref:Uncharacterized protein n=1 Tax=Protomyces lactucae-debilis TaxID=2754530 RepID=A0A1Y2FLL3_PROLT|nr:uncharacterized protein BCR37DRAFT_377721 [Protomyces lactucae-debilis]ORY84891.1 hypothetical protein BCR37DRAFT_377721 [Protomyces lactucae-debilis]
MKCFIFLLYSSLLLFGKFVLSAASPAPAAAAEPVRTAGRQGGTATIGQNTNRGQKRIGDDDGAGPSKKQRNPQARAITPVAKGTCYGLKLQLLSVFERSSQEECDVACGGERQLYRNFLRRTGSKHAGPQSCIQSSICVNTRLLFVTEYCSLSLYLANKQQYQCHCEATLIAFRVRNVKPSNMYLLSKYIEKQRNSSLQGIRRYHIFVADRLTKPGWKLQSAAWNPLVNCNGTSSEAIERENLCACTDRGRKLDGGECTGDIAAQMTIRVPPPITGIDLNKEPEQDSAAAATGSSQQPNHNLQYTQTFSNDDLDPNEVCINPTIAQFGYCSPGP